MDKRPESKPLTVAQLAAIKADEPTRVSIVSVDMSLDQILPVAFKVAIAVLVVNIGFAIIAGLLYGLYRTYLA